jgi:hypothetical protein
LIAPHVASLEVPVYSPEPGDEVLVADKIDLAIAKKPLDAFVAVCSTLVMF